MRAASRLIPAHARALSLASLLPLTLLVAACGEDAAEPEAPAPDASEAATDAETAVDAEAEEGAPADDAAAQEAEVPQPEIAEIGTPMEDRVATIGLLNKRNNNSQDIELKPGESQRVGNVIVRLSACERTAPWELPQETGAFVQLEIEDAGSEEWDRVFSGWLFKNSPSLNVVEHPIYDVWVKDCAMRFPGEDAPAESASSDS